MKRMFTPYRTRSESYTLTLHLAKPSCTDFIQEAIIKRNTVKPLYYGHQGDRNKCPHYRGVRFREVGFIWISVSQGPSELSVIERCP